MKSTIAISQFRSAVVLVLLLVGSTRGQNPGENPAPVPSDSEDFVIHTAEGKDLTGPLRKVEANGTIRIGGARPAIIDGDRIIAVRRGAPAFADRNVLVLSNGDMIRLANSRVVLSDDLLQIEAESLRRKTGLTVRLPATYAALIWFAAPAGDDEEPLVQLRRWQGGKRTEDVVLLRNGDRIEGRVTGMDGEKCQITTRSRKTMAALAEVSAIVFNSELQARIQPRKAYRQLVLKDGTRLGLATLELAADSERLTGKTLFGEQIETAPARVASIEYRLGRAVYLSDLPPTRFTQTPFIGIRRPLALNGNVRDRPLVIGSKAYEQGLGMQPRMEATWPLEGRYRWFEAAVGIDAISQFGAAQVRVLVDGKEAAWSKMVSAGEEPALVRVDIRQAKEITLIADFADFGSVQAYVDWGDALLIKSAIAAEQ